MGTGTVWGPTAAPSVPHALTTPVRDQYAFGVFVVEAGGNTTIAHSGGLDGFNTYMAYDPARRMSVIVLGNLNGPAPDLLGASLLALVREGTSPREGKPRAAALAPETLQAYVGVYDLTATSSITVTIAKGRLMSQATGQDAIALNPGFADVFHPREAGGQITFTRDASGNVAGLVLYQDGRDQIARKT